MTQINCKNLSLGYEGKKIVQNLSFCVNEGDYLCVLGENGSGKTTLIKTLASLIEPLDGEVLRDGSIKKKIGYLPQQSEMQKDFPASVFEIVLSGFVGRGGLSPFYGRNCKLRALENMKKLGIENLLKRCYRELSGGQQQRVLLARALCSGEKVLILDEPTAGLDPIASADMYDIIEELNKNDGVTIIMISHDVQTALKYANRILHIGSVESFFGTKDDYLKSDFGSLLVGRAEGKEDLSDE